MKLIIFIHSFIHYADSFIRFIHFQAPAETQAIFHARRAAKILSSRQRRWQKAEQAPRECWPGKEETEHSGSQKENKKLQLNYDTSPHRHSSSFCESCPHLRLCHAAPGIGPVLLELPFCHLFYERGGVVGHRQLPPYPWWHGRVHVGQDHGCRTRT